MLNPYRDSLETYRKLKEEVEEYKTKHKNKTSNSLDFIHLVLTIKDAWPKMYTYDQKSACKTYMNSLYNIYYSDGLKEKFNDFSFYGDMAVNTNFYGEILSEDYLFNYSEIFSEEKEPHYELLFLKDLEECAAASDKITDKYK